MPRTVVRMYREAVNGHMRGQLDHRQLHADCRHRLHVQAGLSHTLEPQSPASTVDIIIVQEFWKCIRARARARARGGGGGGGGGVACCSLPAVMPN